MIVVIAVGIVAVIAGTGAGFVSGKLYGRSIEYRRNNQSGSADKLKYKLDKYDKKIIKLMKEKYDMTPSFNDDGLYTFDLKTLPSFKDAKF